MILSDSKNNLQRSSDIRETTFTIQASGTAFRVLSDGLYANKIEAIVRELCCNAVDAQVSAGKGDQPFTIHLPTISEPFFSIHDCGIGLTEFEACGGYVDRIVPKGSLNPDGSVVVDDYVVKEYVGGIFNTFFKSTKTDSNDQIGALGLGSKSPLCYVDAFTVESVKNGRKFCFSVFFNENSEPAISTLDEKATDEPNGVKITLPVVQKDHQAFAQACRKVLEWFEVKPIINDEYFTAASRPYLTKAQTWAMCSKFNQYGGDRAIAIMGKIAYPIETSHERLQSDEFRAMLTTPLVLFFDNGTLDFAASRESLSYTNKTIQSIVDRLEQVREELPVSIQEEIDRCPNIWEAKLKWKEAIRESSLKNISHLLKVSFMGIPIKNAHIEIPMKQLAGTTVTHFNQRGKRTTRNLTNEATVSSYETIQVTANPAIYINDLSKGSFTRARNFAKSTNDGLSVYTFDNEGTRKFFEDSIEGCEIKFTSDLPAPEKVKRLPSGRISGDKVTSLVLSSTSSKSIFSKHTEIADSSVGGFYMPVLRGVAQRDDGTKITELLNIMNGAAQMGFVTPSWEVHGFLPSKIERLKKTGPWVNVMDHIKQQMDNLIDFGDLSFLQESSGSDWSNANGYASRYIKTIDLSKFDENHKFRKFVEGLTHNTEASTKSYWFKDLANRMNVDVPVLSGSHQERWAELLKTYPLLCTLMNWYSSEIKKEAIEQYLLAIDSM
jgi:hypothetical protein